MGKVSTANLKVSVVGPGPSFFFFKDYLRLDQSLDLERSESRFLKRKPRGSKSAAWWDQPADSGLSEQLQMLDCCPVARARDGHVPGPGDRLAQPGIKTVTSSTGTCAPDRNVISIEYGPVLCIIIEYMRAHKTKRMDQRMHQCTAHYKCNKSGLPVVHPEAHEYKFMCTSPRT